VSIGWSLLFLRELRSLRALRWMEIPLYAHSSSAFNRTRLQSQVFSRRDKLTIEMKFVQCCLLCGHSLEWEQMFVFTARASATFTRYMRLSRIVASTTATRRCMSHRHNINDLTLPCERNSNRFSDI